MKCGEKYDLLIKRKLTLNLKCDFNYFKNNFNMVIIIQQVTAKINYVVDFVSVSHLHAYTNTYIHVCICVSVYN